MRVKDMKLLMLAFMITASVRCESPPAAAIIVGGYDDERVGGIVRDEVEVFGCEGGSHTLANYPFNVHGAAGIFWKGG